MSTSCLEQGLQEWRTVFAIFPRPIDQTPDGRVIWSKWFTRLERQRFCDDRVSGESMVVCYRLPGATSFFEKRKFLGL